MRDLLAISAAAVMLATPALAQQKATDPAAMQKLASFNTGFIAAFKKEDAAALSTFYATNAVYVGVTGKVFKGRQQVEEAYTILFKQVGGLKSVETTPDEAHSLRDGTIWGIGHATITGNTATYNNHYAALYVPQGKELKLRMLSIGANVQPQPQTAQSPSTR
jgi:uncharacterized protein (TIGR02246 family)